MEAEFKLIITKFRRPIVPLPSDVIFRSVVQSPKNKIGHFITILNITTAADDRNLSSQDCSSHPDKNQQNSIKHQLKHSNGAAASYYS